MTERKAHAEKVMVLGVDGLDPRFSKRMIDAGKMPNLAEYVKRGVCREDMVLLGGHPCITPPMWTTLATGCYANVHGITGFYRQHPDDLSAVTYALDSRDCKAEQVWNCTAEAGKKTLVFHWPGSSWPPSSDSENLFVVDGTSPGALGMATSQTEKDFLFIAGENISQPRFVDNVDPNIVALCVVEELPERSKTSWNIAEGSGKLDKMSNCVDFDGPMTDMPKIDAAQSYIRPAQGWIAAPEGAKECELLLNRGLIRRPCLILKDENGIYSQLAIYKSKKQTEPIVTLEVGKIQGYIIDEGFNKNDEKITVLRNMKLLSLGENGQSLTMWVSAAMDVNVYDTWHPQRMYDYVKEVAGPTPPTANLFEQVESIHYSMMDAWQISMDWQVKAIHEIVKREGIEVVFSHMHDVDLVNHTFISFLSKMVADGAKDMGGTKIDHEEYVRWQEELYMMTDAYLGEFLHYLDEGWSVIVTSDHAQTSAKYGAYPFLGQMQGYHVQLFEEWGYLTMKRDAEGNRIREVDWSKTKAIPNRSNDIWINLKGRQAEGIVDPSEKYELEEEIMTKLYELKHPMTGKRVVSVALRNKDAVLLGLGGPESGDIVYFLTEGYNTHHGDQLSTTYGEEDTSVSPIFVAAGPGFKKGEYTDRVIRQIDVAPTIAAILGVKMPAQAEGSPAYQILDYEF